MKKLILTVVMILNAPLSFAVANFDCSFTPYTEHTPYLSYWIDNDDSLSYSPGDPTCNCNPFKLVANLSARFDNKPGEQITFTNKNENGAIISDSPQYAGFTEFCPTNVCRIMIDSPKSTGRLSGVATAMIQKKTHDGNFKNYKALTCRYKYD